MIRHGYLARCKALWSVTLFKASPNMIERMRNWSLAVINGDGSTPLGSALLASISLGIRDILPDSVINEFKALGLAHLLVLSGYQVTLVYITLIYLLTALLKVILTLRPIYPTRSIKPLLTAVAVLITSLLVAIAGFDGASTRALLAAVFCVVFQWRESAPPPFQSLALAMIGLNTIWPGSFLEPGTQLTFAALIGLALAPNTGPGWWRLLVASTWATTLSSLVAALWFGQLSLAGFLLNPILAPALSALACYGVALVLLIAPFSRLFSDSLVLVLGSSMEVIAAALHPLSQQNWAKISPSPTLLLGLLLFLSAIIVVIIAMRSHRWLILNGVRARSLYD
jgi:competence protein ComEC